MVASSMFTRRAGAGSAEARRASANLERGSRLGGQEQKLGSRAKAWSTEARSETQRCGIVIL